jgi:hypothetical protein
MWAYVFFRTELLGGRSVARKHHNFEKVFCPVAWASCRETVGFPSLEKALFVQDVLSYRLLRTGA